MIQQEDFWDLVSRHVDVYRADPVRTESGSIVLEDGRTIPTDYILCGTGWDTSYAFLSSRQIVELGLPHSRYEGDPKEEDIWQELMEDSDRQIINDYPILASPPPSHKPSTTFHPTPARLYQGMVPLSDQSIVFLGRARVSNSFRTAEAQAIWATAYWDGYITLPPLKEAQKEVAYMNTFSRRRYPTHGLDGVNFHADLIWYTDALLQEAGLSSHRKGWWNDPHEPALASDMCDCKDEYLSKYQS